MEPAPRYSHPDFLALDAIRAGEGEPADAAHVEACEACRDRVAELGRLADDILELSRGAGAVPAEVDRRVLDMARRRPVRGRRNVLLRLSAAAALALAAALAIYLTGRMGAPVLARDIDRDGSVDIVDAYALALRVRSSAPLEPAWDLDGDGSVDRKDAEALARQVVSIEGRLR